MEFQSGFEVIANNRDLETNLLGRSPVCVLAVANMKKLVGLNL